MGSHNLSSPTSNQIARNKVGTDVYNNYNSQSFEIPQEHNHTATKVSDTTTTTNQIHPKDSTRPFQ